MNKLRKQKIGIKEYSFEFTNKTFLKLDEKFDKAGDIFNGVLTGKNHISNSIKLICVSCKEKEWTPEELAESATSKQFLELPTLANNLELDYFGTKEKDELKEEDTKDNKKK